MNKHKTALLTLALHVVSPVMATQLHDAIGRHDLHTINKLIADGANIEETNQRGLTPLQYATQRDKQSAMISLIKAGANKEAIMTEEGLTPLHIAAGGGFHLALTTLLKAGANIEATSKGGLTPLHIAAALGRRKATMELIAAGANKEATDSEGKTPLYCAIEEGRYPTSMILIDAGANIKATDSKGFTLLHIAARYGRPEFISPLILAGADIEATNRNGLTSLHIAAAHGKLEVVAALIKAGANINAVNPNRLTPLHLACAYGRTKIISTLTEAGADTSAADQHGFTSHDILAHKDNALVIQSLIQKGIYPKIILPEQTTPLHDAVLKGDPQTVVNLIEADANIEANNSKGNTPLHYAAMCGDLEMITILATEGANIHAINQEGMTPLQMAIAKDHYQAIPVFVEKGANITTASQSGDTLLHIAAGHNRLKSITALIQEGADIEAIDQDGLTPLERAVDEGKLEAATMLMEIGANIRNSLCIAAKRGHHVLIMRLIQNGANINATDAQGFTPLHLAAIEGHNLAITTLIKNCANIDAIYLQNIPQHIAQAIHTAFPQLAATNTNLSYKLSPLDFAGIYCNQQSAMILLKYGANPMPATSMVKIPASRSNLNFTHMTPLELFASHLDTTSHFVTNLIKEYYLKAIADNGDTVLHRLISNRLLDPMVDKLIEQILKLDNGSLNLNHKNDDGYTILHTGATHNPQLLAPHLKVLLARGADRKATTPCGDTFNSLTTPSWTTRLQNLFFGLMEKSHWTDLMHFVHGITDLTEDVKEDLIRRIAECNDPAYVTDYFDSALSVARSEDVKNCLRTGILKNRRKHISEELQTTYQQPKVLADLILQFAGTYEPQQ